MREDQTCENCEWWDRPTDKRDIIEPRVCFRWPGEPWLRTYKRQKCWQWCARGKGGNNPPRGKQDLEAAVQLVLEAGASTGHADTCVELVEELLRDRAELYAKVNGARRLLELYVQGPIKLPVVWDKQIRAWLKSL